jgi:hypothetical protein
MNIIEQKNYVVKRGRNRGANYRNTVFDDILKKVID